MEIDGLMNVYFISGLGADRRIFSNINLRPDLKIIHVNWIAFGKKESLEKYAARLSLQIDTSISFALVGVSFGGIIAVELAKLLKPSATVIISSSVKRTELPLTY
ncbi:alpha/beta fold hydrolase [Pedobacter sp. AW1-32]|uniref:alpha/beta fold hydrolase n=1 Tax=Pedobacter sp. AW1-32 TaxID=3383026 RepID=UPI003FEF6436